MNTVLTMCTLLCKCIILVLNGLRGSRCFIGIDLFCLSLAGLEEETKPSPPLACPWVPHRRLPITVRRRGENCVSCLLHPLPCSQDFGAHETQVSELLIPNPAPGGCTCHLQVPVSGQQLISPRKGQQRGEGKRQEN